MKHRNVKLCKKMQGPGLLEVVKRRLLARSSPENHEHREEGSCMLARQCFRKYQGG